MATLRELASVVMDTYHREYVKDDEFFNQEYFESMCAGAYASLLQRDYENAKAENRAILGFSFVTISPDWLKEIKLKVTKDKDVPYYVANIPSGVSIFPFEFDALDSGIQTLSSITGKCSNEFIKIAAKDVWRLKLLPVCPAIFFYRVGCELRFYNVRCSLTDEELTMLYAPDITSKNADAYIPSSKELPILNLVIQIMTASKTGEPVDMTNNANHNAIPQTEIDKRSA